MNECKSFNDCNLRNICRACLRTAENVSAMVSEEINLYRCFVSQFQIPNEEYEMQICGVCKWTFKKYIKFTIQCQKAYEILCNLNLETEQTAKLPNIAHHFSVSRIEHTHIGPDYNIDELGDELPDHDGYITCDEEDLPLMMLSKNISDETVFGPKKNNGLKRIKDVEIKLEDDIKREFEVDTQEPYKSKVKREKMKKELKQGFSSRMVQETEEYMVIKLSREQVLQEMDEKSKSDVYLRAPYKCVKCMKGFNFEDVLSSHMDKHSMKNGTYQCDICTQFCPSAVSLRGHLKSHTTRYKCKVCGHVRLSRQHLLEHHAITHTGAAAAYRCDTCPFTTNKRTVIQRHVKTHVCKEQHACDQCGKLFKSIDSLRVHTMRHDKSRRYQCEQCDKAFIYPSLLHKHVQAVHERKDYYCVECDVKFKSSETLRLHFKKAKRHRDMTSYKFQCAHCSERLFTASSLSAHEAAAHGGAREHACGACARAYPSRDALRAHRWRAHAPRATPPPTCTVCRNTFSRASVLKVHMRSHSAARPHAQHKNQEDTSPEAEGTICSPNEP